VDYVLCYALYAVLLALSYVVFVIWLHTSSLLIGVAMGDEARSAGYGLAVLGIGIGLFGVVMIGEPYLRGGVRRGQIRQRFLRLALPLAGTIALGIAIQELIYDLT
jgi:hypothetical protein